MKKRKHSLDEFCFANYLFREEKVISPKNLATLQKRGFDLVGPYVDIEQAMYGDLIPVIEVLIDKQYPWLRQENDLLYTRWIHEVADDMSQVLVSDMLILFYKLSINASYREKFEDFDGLVAFYTDLRVPNMLPQKREDFDPELIACLDDLSEWERKETLDEWEMEEEETYLEEKEECDRFNTNKAEFIEAVQPIVFKYLGEQTLSFDAEQWINYGFIMGWDFYQLHEYCEDLDYLYNYADLTVNQELTFREFNKKYSDEHFPLGE